MKRSLLLILAIISTTLCLSGCVKKQQAPNANTQATNPADLAADTDPGDVNNMNDTNYEDELREQSARGAADAAAAGGHGGGHGR